MKMTKFPGGGLCFGEGTVDCLKREAIEEFGQEIEIIEHYYTTHFFQQALFYSDQQLISIYYLARFPEAPRFKISDKPFDFPEMINESQSFRWARIAGLAEKNLSFPIDRFVIGLLKSNTKPAY
jgi:ADP-ribose pyrophosphatase YjhB (NUDIX family)